MHLASDSHPVPRVTSPAVASVVEAVAAERERVALLLEQEIVKCLAETQRHIEQLQQGVDDPAAVAHEVRALEETVGTASTRLAAAVTSLRRPRLAVDGLAVSLRQRIAPLDAGSGTAVVDDLQREPPAPIAMVFYWVAEELVRAFRVTGRYGAIDVRLRSVAGGFTLDVTAASLLGQDGPLVRVDEARRLAQLIGAPLTVDESDRSRSCVHVIAAVPAG